MKLLLLLAAVACLSACGGGGGGGGGAAGGGEETAVSLEARFQGPGPAAVIQTTALSDGLTYVVYSPSTLASDGYLNPVVAYGNGSQDVCNGSVSRPYASHLASWGFVVICPESPSTGLGTQILQAVNFIVAENGRAGSAFEGQLDTRAIATSGHSQGATGALNANVLAKGLVKTTLALAFVDPEYHSGRGQPALRELTGPVFLASGCDDPLTTWQDNYFDEFVTPVVKACRVGTAHVAMAAATHGYAVAWFMYTLRGDARARGAFVAADGRPEIALNPLWQRWRSKQLP